MKQLEGYENDKDMVCRFIKNLYELKQVSRVWNQKIWQYLKFISFNQTCSDSCVYVSKNTEVIIAIWVNDLIIIEKDMINIQALKVALNKEYEMNDLGELKYFLIIQIHCNKEQNSFTLVSWAILASSLNDTTCRIATLQEFHSFKISNSLKQRSQTPSSIFQSTKALLAVRCMSC